jgi:hypothetical protein
MMHRVSVVGLVERCSAAGVVCLAFLVVALGCFGGCRTSWAETKNTTRNLTVGVESPGETVAVSANGQSCGNTPTRCRVEVTESKIYHYSRNAWMGYVGYGAVSVGPVAVLVGFPMLIPFGGGKGGSVAGATLMGIGGALVLGGGLLLAIFAGYVKEKYKGVTYEPERVVIQARTAGGRVGQRVLPTKLLVRDPTGDVRFSLPAERGAGRQGEGRDEVGGPGDVGEPGEGNWRPGPPPTPAPEPESEREDPAGPSI